MKKVMVIGSGGSGKSTFSRKLGDITGIGVIHLDSVFWRPGWQRTPTDEWESEVARMVLRDSWIMDGNFGGTRLIRIKACDTVILLDIPRYRCVYRIINRALRYRGMSRPGMAAGCDEKIDLEFLSWVWNYPRRGRERAFEEMKQFPEKRFVVLRSPSEVDGFLREASLGVGGNGNGRKA
jgi:adenylate kinase family enzyme